MFHPGARWEKPQFLSVPSAQAETVTGYRAPKLPETPSPSIHLAESSPGHTPKKRETLGKRKLSKKHLRYPADEALAANEGVRAASDPIPKLPDTSVRRGFGHAATNSIDVQLCHPASSTLEGFLTNRPKHVPSLVQDHEPLAASSASAEIRRDPCTTSIPRKPEKLSASDSLSTPRWHSYLHSNRSSPRHVEIGNPSCAQPSLKVPQEPPQIELRQSALSPFAGLYLTSPSDSPNTSFGSGRLEVMETLGSGSKHASSTFINGESQPQFSSAHSSQSSLGGHREEYQSPSETDTDQDEDPKESRSSTLSNNMPTMAPTQSRRSKPNSNSAQLSGLVCNVHRTTGREPSPLVGATTTVLGDKLYVFGGRKLSRTKPLLTSNLYELDLIRRHWTKLEVTGDVPPPRYFHSVCPLGDTKLVCYGGMSPGVAASGIERDTQAEIRVMSDIHIFDVQTRMWTKVATPGSPEGRYAHCAAILPSSAVFASPDAPSSALHHNPPGAQVNQGSLGVEIDGTGGAEMVVVGGQDSANHYIEQVSVFNLRSLRWTDTHALGRSCGAYRSVVTPLTTMSASQIGAGVDAQGDHENDTEDEDEVESIGSGAPMLIYSNYNFLNVKLEMHIRQTDGTLIEKPLKAPISPPGLRFPNGGVIANHFVVSGTFLTSSKQEYALWALDLRTLTWSRIDAGGSIFSSGSWNRGVLWNRRSAFVVLGSRKRSLVDDYNNRRINFSNMCLVELEGFGLYDSPRQGGLSTPYQASIGLQQSSAESGLSATGKQLSRLAEDLGTLSMDSGEMADMDFLAIDGTRIPVNSRLIARRWGTYYTNLLRESLITASETETDTLRAETISSSRSQQSRHSAVTITPSIISAATTLTANSTWSDPPDTRSAPPPSRPRLFYLPHTGPTLQALLYYLYTSSLPSPPHPLATPQIFCSLLQLARPYNIAGLLEAVVERLHELLDSRNAAAIFNAAAMAAGGGDGINFASTSTTLRRSAVPVRVASLAGLDGIAPNGATSRSGSSLHIDTDAANGGRSSTRNTTGQDSLRADESDDEVSSSANTDTSTSDFEDGLTSKTTRRSKRDREAWNGILSPIAGLQKRALRGLLEGRRLRERGKAEAVEAGVGLGIASA